MNIEKTKSFDKNVKGYSSQPGLATSVKEALDKLEKNEISQLHAKMLTGKSFPKGTMKIRIGNYRLIFQVIPIHTQKKVHIQKNKNKNVAVVAFEKRGMVYEKRHRNEFLQKVADIKRE